MSKNIFNFIFKTSQYPDFEMGTESLFLSFQNSLSASYLPISQEPLDENSSLTSLSNSSLTSLSNNN